MNRLVAIVGLPGTGKSEAVSIFEEYGFKRVYFGGITIETLKERGMAINEANERQVREQLRTEHGMAAYAKLSIPKIDAGLKDGSVVIDGMYSWEEFLLLKEKFPNMEVLAIYSPPSIRYQRLAKRPVRPLTVDQARSRDIAQIEKLNQAGPIAMADSTVINTENLNDLIEKIKEYING